MKLITEKDVKQVQKHWNEKRKQISKIKSDRNSKILDDDIEIIEFSADLKCKAKELEIPSFVHDYKVFDPMFIIFYVSTEILKDIDNDFFEPFTFSNNKDVKEKKKFEKKIFNIMETAEIIGKSYDFVSNLIKDETLKTMPDNKHITGKEINKYLEN